MIITISSNGIDEDATEKLKNNLTLLLRQTLKPEFVNRVDDIVMFKPLTREEINEIVKLQVKKVSDRLAEKDVKFSVSDKAVAWLSAQGYDPLFGARPIKRLIQEVIVNQLSKELIAGTINKERTILAEIEGGNLVLKN